MERARHLSQFWAWLPAFRVVAETTHLPTAAKTLGVTPSALSRSVRVLEDALGHNLFDRKGKRLVLNATGELFLEVVRDSMRLVHEGVLGLDDARYVGKATVFATSPWGTLLALPALEKIRTAYPGIIPELTSQLVAEVSSALRRGALDLAIVESPKEDKSLHFEALADVPQDVFCRNNHALARKKRIRAEDLADMEFVRCEHTSMYDDWPPSVTRRVSISVSDTGQCAEAIRGSDRFAVMPTWEGKRLNLHALKVPGMRDLHLFIVHRRSLPLKGRTECIAEALHQAAQDCKTHFAEASG